MTSLQYTNPQSDLAALQLRRSDRKKTKKIIKDDFLLPNPFKTKTKRNRSLHLPQNLDCQIKKIQFLTQRTLAMLNYGRQQFSLQMLKEMKQAVSQQQQKLSEFVSIKLIVESPPQSSGALNSLKFSKQSMDKQNIRGSTCTLAPWIFDKQDHKQALAISTAEQLYCSLSQLQSPHNPQQQQQNVFELADPTLRKQSSKLFSDNYENHELFYTIDHLNLNWHKDQEIMQEAFLN